MATILPTSIFINPGYKFTAFCKTIVMPLNMMNNNFENICDRLALHPELRQHILLLHSIPFHTSIDITLICICLHNISRLCFQNCPGQPTSGRQRVVERCWECKAARFDNCSFLDIHLFWGTTCFWNICSKPLSTIMMIHDWCGWRMRFCLIYQPWLNVYHQQTCWWYFGHHAIFTSKCDSLKKSRSLLAV